MILNIELREIQDHYPKLKRVKPSKLSPIAMWEGSKSAIMPYIYALCPFHKISTDTFSAWTPWTFLKPDVMIPEEEIINDWHRDVSGVLWCFQDLPEEYFPPTREKKVRPSRAQKKPGTFQEFTYWWDRLAGDCQLLFDGFKLLYYDIDLWNGLLSLAHRSALFLHANRVRFAGQWHGSTARNAGTFTGHLRTEKKKGGKQVTRQVKQAYSIRPRVSRKTAVQWIDYKERLCRPNVGVRCEDAFGGIINDFDSYKTLHLIDPPYKDSSMAYPDQEQGFSKEKQRALEDLLEQLQGYFVLTVRPWLGLLLLADKERWVTVKTGRKSSLGNLKRSKKKFNEVLMMNYDPREKIEMMHMRSQDDSRQTRLSL